MMPSLGTRLILFLSSYAPLFAILAFKVHSSSFIASWLLGGIAILSVGGLYLWVFKWLPKKNRMRIQPAKIESNDEQAVSYIVFYLFPFLDIIRILRVSWHLAFCC